MLSPSGSYTAPFEVFAKLRNFVDIWSFLVVISGRQFLVGVSPDVGRGGLHEYFKPFP